MSNHRRMLGTRGGGAQRPQIVEALRSVRLSLMNAYGSAGPMVVAITSPGSGDGKTFMTSNLGLTFADLGLRTILIDGDTRRGVMHRLFDTERRPGLTDYLSGNVEFEQIVRGTKYEHLYMIPAGARMLNSPELLSASRMGDLLARIKASYDVILIDTPPLGAGVDPLVLGTLAGSMLLVMRTGNTDRSVAQAKLKMLERLPIRVLGTVLNGFDSADSYYYYSYMPGYESADEVDKPVGQLEPA